MRSFIGLCDDISLINIKCIPSTPINPENERVAGLFIDTMRINFSIKNTIAEDDSKLIFGHHEKY